MDLAFPVEKSACCVVLFLLNLVPLDLILNRLPNRYTPYMVFWKFIDNVKDILYEHIKIKIGFGDCTSFWKDKWLGDFRNQHILPRLFHFCRKKYGGVTDFWTPNSSSWMLHHREICWRKKLKNGLGCPNSQLELLQDRWCWKFEKDGVYTAKFLSKVLSNCNQPDAMINYRVNWSGKTPNKVKFFIGKKVKFFLGNLIMTPFH